MGFVVWIFVVWWASGQLPGWDWWFWILTVFLPPLLALPIIEAVS